MANLLRIPFYLDYKQFEMNIVILTPFVDKVLWSFSGLVFSILLFAMFLKKGFKGSRVISLVLFVLVVASSVFALMSNFDVYGTLAFMIVGLVFLAFSFLQTKFIFGKSKNMMILVILYGMFLLLLIEVASLGRWVYNLFSPSLVFSDESWTIAFAETQISSILYFALPVLMMIFAFSWVGELTIKGLLGGTADSDDQKKGYIDTGILSLKPSLIVGIISIVAVLFLGYYHFAVSGLYNPAFPGTDVQYYIERLGEMKSMNAAEALSYATGNDRFLYLVFQYVCFSVSGMSPDVFVTFVMPVILVLLLMFSTFFLVKCSGQSLFYAASIMLVTVFSFMVTVGIYAGFYANLFALVFVFVFYGFLMVVLNGHHEWFFLVLTGFSSVAVLFVHPWTWILVVMMNLATYMFVTLIMASIRKKDLRGHKWELGFLLILFVVNLLTFYVRRAFGVSGGGELIGGYVNVVTFQPSLLNVFAFKYFLDTTFNYYVGGFYGYVPMIALAIVGVFSLAGYKNRYNRLLLTWVLIASSMVFVDFPWHARFLFDVPFNIFASLGILFVGEWLYRFVSVTELRRLAPLVFWIFFALSILFLFNYAVRCMVLKQFGPPGLTIQP
jgi:hypothetical protein